MTAPLATRRVARRIASGSASGTLYFFGPFLPGEGVADMVLAVQATPLPAAGVVREMLLSVGVTPTAKAATVAVFLAECRLLGDANLSLPIGGANTDTTTYNLATSWTDTNTIPITTTGTILGTVARTSYDPQVADHVLPLNWQATADERYLGVVVYGPTNGTLQGSLWIRTTGCPDPTPVVPESPGEVEVGCA